MIFILPAYFVGLIVIIMTINRRKDKFSDYPKLKVTSFGLSFYSLARHRLKIDDATIMQLGNMVYLKKEDKLIILKNIDKIMRKNDYLYFVGLGEVTIFMDTKEIYKYFNINVSTPKLDFSTMKQRASRDILSNIFDMSKCKYVNTYMKLVKMLNITFTKDKLVVKPNKLHLPFTLTYKLNNKIKKVHIKDEF